MVFQVFLDILGILEYFEIFWGILGSFRYYLGILRILDNYQIEILCFQILKV